MARRTSQIVLWILLAIVVAIGIGVIVVLRVPPPMERWLQARVLLALRQHYRANVQLENLHVTLIPSFSATADNFVLPNRGGDDLPPLITVKHITVRSALPELLRSPIHLSWVKLDGMEIRVAHKHHEAGSTAATPQKREREMRLANFVIDKLDADGTELYILRKDPSREPLNFDLRRLMLRSAGVDQPMAFTAELTNPTPPGLIDTSGHFGPWVFDEPSDTKVDGHYVFQHADLSVFNGISGILSSVGDYRGVLHNIVVDGTTDTPDFKLDSGGEAVHLTTKFHAIVDGSNGNTYLQPVDAHFLDSEIVTNGEIVGHPGQPGKTINLDIDIENAHVQDVLSLAAKAQPAALTGNLAMKAKLQLPPGHEPVLRKMLLDGTFSVSNAHFTGDKIKNTIAELSRRGQGKPGDTSIVDVPAQFAGDFDLRHENLTFARLQVYVPGVSAQMKGGYGIGTQELGFTGDVKLHATVSQTMKGPGHWMLVPFDPLFSKHGAGTYLPVAISGTRDHPEVKLQLGKIF